MVQVIKNQPYQIGQLHFQSADFRNIEKLINLSREEHVLLTDRYNKQHALHLRYLENDGIFTFPNTDKFIYLSKVPVNFGYREVFELIEPICEIKGHPTKAITFLKESTGRGTFSTGQVKVRVERFLRKPTKIIRTNCGNFYVTVDRIVGYEDTDMIINFV